MNKIFTFLVLSIICFNAKAQYQSLFGTNNTSWNIKHDQLFGFVSDSLVHEADTTINGDLYKKVIRYTWGSQGYFRVAPDIYINENINSGLWYARSSFDLDTAYLMMDMNLEVGDSFYFNFNNSFSEGYRHVIAVNTINNRKVIEFDFDIAANFSERENFIFIEGVGSNAGIEINLETIGLNKYLLCYHRNLSTQYQNQSPTLGSMCNTIILNNPETTENQEYFYLSFFPNPASNYVNVMLHRFSKTVDYGFLRLTDLEGRLLMELKVDHSNHLNQIIYLNTSNLPNGMYLLQYVEENKSFRTRKLFVSR